MRIFLNHRKRMERLGIEPSILETTVQECERDFGTIVELVGNYTIKNRAVTSFNIELPINGKKRLVLETIYGTVAFVEGEFSFDFDKEGQLEFSF